MERVRYRWLGLVAAVAIVAGWAAMPGELVRVDRSAGTTAGPSDTPNVAGDGEAKDPDGDLMLGTFASLLSLNRPTHLRLALADDNHAQITEILADPWDGPFDVGTRIRISGHLGHPDPAALEQAASVILTAVEPDNADIIVLLDTNGTVLWPVGLGPEVEQTLARYSWDGASATEAIHRLLEQVASGQPPSPATEASMSPEEAYWATPPERRVLDDELTPRTILDQFTTTVLLELDLPDTATNDPAYDEVVIRIRHPEYGAIYASSLAAGDHNTPIYLPHGGILIEVVDSSGQHRTVITSDLRAIVTTPNHVLTIVLTGIDPNWSAQDVHRRLAASHVEIHGEP